MQKKLIYLDNAATSFPKPPEVISSMANSVRNCGNPGRGAHRLAMRAATEMYKCRCAAAELFGASPNRVVFTSGATQSLNIAINAASKMDGAVLISDLEHNSVVRPVIALGKEIRVFTSALYCLGEERTFVILDSILTHADGACILVCTAASNVCGASMPIREIGRFCRERGILFIVDGAQAGGVFDLNVDRDFIDVLCLPSHKGLLGPMGCGLMILGEDVKLPPFLFGGSGVDSKAVGMPELPPERYEAGTLPLPIIAGLRSGIELVKKKTPARIREHEKRLASVFKSNLPEGRVKVFAPEHTGGTVLFNAYGVPCEELASRLDENGICTRAGLHCAPLAHSTLGSYGAVRVSFGAFNTEADAITAAYAIKSIIE